MPMALATTEVSLTASEWPRPAQPVPPPEVEGEDDGVADGDAALAASGPRTAAPPAPLTSKAPATTAFAARPIRLDGAWVTPGSADAAGSIAAGSASSPGSFAA